MSSGPHQYFAVLGTIMGSPKRNFDYFLDHQNPYEHLTSHQDTETRVSKKDPPQKHCSILHDDEKCFTKCSVI